MFIHILIYNIHMFCKHILLIKSFNEPELIFFLHTAKWSHVSITIKHQSFVCTYSLEVILFFNELELICLHTSIIVSTQLNAFNYCYLTLLIIFDINHLFADSGGPVLDLEPNVVWLLVTVLVVAVVFVTTTLDSDCLLCQVLPCLRYVWKIHKGGLTQFSRIFFWLSGNMSG